MKRFFVVALTTAACAAYVAAQQAPATGAGRRPGDGRSPDGPVPTIREYKPRSTLVVPQHHVPRAKFPVVDIHGHPPALTSVDVVNRIGDSMSPLNLQVMVDASSRVGDSIPRSIEAIRGSRYKGRFVTFAGLDLQDVGPGSGAAIAGQLEADVRAGAVGVGEIMKSFGLSIRKRDGSRLKLDDAELDPVWKKAAALNVPVLIHTGDPAEFFQPLDYHNERWLELALFRERRFDDRSRYPSFDELMAERDRMILRNPGTTWILAHLGWHAQDLGRLGKLFDQHPRLHAEVGAVLYDLGRQPRMAHEFFLKYQDRILFGKDSYQPDEYPYYWRVFETTDDYFDYYRDYHAFWKLYGIGLPDPVLKKVYYQNALRVVPGIPRAGFPN
jgi:predicted TIM-barrel fold metal-dependent hydrolase